MQLIGLARLGRDAEARTVGENVVANLSLAFDYYDPKAEKKRSTTWIDGALWGRQAEALEQYLTKGSQVCVTIDDLHLETYEGRNGQGTKLVGRITTIRLAGGRAEGQAASPAPAPRQAPAAAPRAAAPRAPAPDFDDESIPF
jgi:single-strand DNA-binding protein